MTVTVATFRTSFPEFANPGTYPDPEIQFWLTLGGLLINLDRWGDLADYGVQMFVGHNLSLEFNAKRAAQMGQNPGFVIGTVTGGTVDRVSYQRDASAAMNPANGHWNLTIYGLRYIQMVKMIGMGPVQVGVGSQCGVLPWAGPWQYNVPNPS